MQFDIRGKVLDLNKVRDDKKAPAFIKLLARDIQDNGYLVTGDYLSDMSTYDLFVLHSFVELVSSTTKLSNTKEASEQYTDVLKYLYLTTMLFCTAEGMPEIDGNTADEHLPNLSLMVFLEYSIRVDKNVAEKISLRGISITDNAMELLKNLKN
jgi:hypothetical protein